MAQKKIDNSAYEALKLAIKNKQLGKLYVFHGEERYLLENALLQIRKLLVDGDFADFNYKKFTGSGITVDALAAACDMLPVFAERTFLEVNDFDIFKANDEAKQKLIALISDLPDYVCLIFVYDVVEYAPDGRQKLAALFKSTANIVEFNVQEQSQLIKWIKKHFLEIGKKIDTPTAEYLAFITGGLMTSLNLEINKVGSSTNEETITREHIDAVVTPVLDAVIYELTDYIVSGDFNNAAHVLQDLLSMREVPHKLMYSIAMKLRQLMAARLCIESGLGEKKLMELCAIRFDFQARNLLTSARKATLDECRRAVIYSTQAAYRMNSGSDPEDQLIELLIRLAENRRSMRPC
jgi:DNA polymerase III subunit delta